MEEINITAEVRQNKSTKKELMEARKKGGLNAILNLKLGKATETVIVKELQRHPVSDRPVHADFQRISLTQKIEAKVPLHVHGEAPGVKLDGGILQHELRVLTIRALPTKIPQSIDVDISALGMGDHILVKDLKVGGDFEIVDNLEHIVVHVTQVKVEEVAPVPGAVAPTEAAAAAEPESSSTKGKKDEEGKVLPKDAKAPDAAKGGKDAAKKEPAKKEGAK